MVVVVKQGLDKVRCVDFLSLSELLDQTDLFLSPILSLFELLLLCSDLLVKLSESGLTLTRLTSKFGIDVD